eukprot:3773665-Amphidinium_carterae.1
MMMMMMMTMMMMMMMMTMTTTQCALAVLNGRSRAGTLDHKRAWTRNGRPQDHCKVRSKIKKFTRLTNNDQTVGQIPILTALAFATKQTFLRKHVVFAPTALPLLRFIVSVQKTLCPDGRTCQDTQRYLVPLQTC